MSSASATTPSPIAGSLNAAHLRPRRNPRMVAAGVLLCCLGALGGVALHQHNSNAQQVLVMANPVARGETVEAKDLGVVSLGAAPGVSTVSADRLGELVGKQALVDLPDGSLVGNGAVGQAVQKPGTSLVGLKLAAGRIPVQPLPAGTPVQLVQVGSDKAPGELVVDAVVVSAPTTTDDGSGKVLDVAVPQADAQALADLAARDLVALVRKAS